MIGLGDARDYVLSALEALPVEEVNLADSWGCAVANDVVAREQVPHFANSSMDGFALLSSDTKLGETRLRIVDSIFAGRVTTKVLQSGEAMRIMTGAMLPDGADAVCRVEDVTVDDLDYVVIPRSVEAQECVRLPGEDVRIGQVLLRAHCEVTPAVRAILAGQGMSTVRIHRRPVVGVLSTGDELCGSGLALEPGQIRDLNRPLLLALLHESGFRGVDLGIVNDDYDAIAQSLADAVAQCDAVITTGGVSVGDVDFVKGVLHELARGNSRTMQVAIKPAKPFAFGRIGSKDTPVFALPGNPVSTRVSFELFVRPALRILGGHQLIERLELDAILDVALPTPIDKKTHLVHVVTSVATDGRVHVVGVARRNSHLLSAIADCNALTILTPEGTYEVGSVARTMILDANALGRASAMTR